MTPEELIAIFDLKPLPQEGGYYSESYRSSDTLLQSALPERYGRDKSASTCIYYMLTAGVFSAFHRLKTDEIYHFYLGDPVELVLLHLDGSLSSVLLGSNILYGQHLQYVVPKGVWQGSALVPGGNVALMGCTVAPGYDADDYEHGHWETLLRQYPAHHAIIMKLTKK
jgi:predicted cupin superfamily sugar epimerase